MTVAVCVSCEQNPLEKRRFGGAGLADGIDCPVCHTPTCRYHLTTVRWKWRETGKADSALVCKECKRTYEHRRWESHVRDWVT